MPASDELPSYQFTPVCQRVHPEQRANVTYELILRQQPKQSRMCGVGEKADRRPIDPPPIVQLIVKTPPSSVTTKSSSGFTSYLQNPYYFMHASLVEKDTREDVLLIKDTRSKEDMHLFKDNRTKATTGSSVSSLYPLKDFEDSGTESGFFVFPDLSVRMEGTYRLKFCLYEMVGKDVHFCAYVISDPLVVYSAKKFPGMEESTLLSQYFAEQGLKIRIRKEVRPKKRSRGEYLAAPASQSPTESQQRDAADQAESQDDEDSTAGADAPLTSKRRASGTRSVESRRDEAPLTPQKDSAPTENLESRQVFTSRSGGLWRGHAPEYSEYQATSSVADRPRSAPESVPQQQGYFEESSFTARRFSAANRTADGVSHMDLNSGQSASVGTRPEPHMEDHCMRPQDQSIPGPSSSRLMHTPYRGPSVMGKPGIEGHLPDHTRVVPPTTTNYFHPTETAADVSKPQMGPPMGQDTAPAFESGVPAGPSYVRHGAGPVLDGRDEMRRGSGAGVRREPAPEPVGFYESRGSFGSQRHPREHQQATYPMEEPRAPHPQSFSTRSSPAEAPYSYPPRQGHSSSGSFSAQRLMDYGALASYQEGHAHRGSVSSNPYDRSDHLSRLPPDTPFHSGPQPTQHPAHTIREHGSMEVHTHPAQGSPGARSRPPAHHDSYSGIQHQEPPPHHYTLSHGAYGAADTQSSSQAPHTIERRPSGNYPAVYQEEPMLAQGRYLVHGHPPYPGPSPTSARHGHRDDSSSLRRESLPSSPTRQDHRSQSMPHFAQGAPLPVKTIGHSLSDNASTVGYGPAASHRDRETDGVQRHVAHASSGYSSYQDGPSQPISGAGHYARSASTSVSYASQAHDHVAIPRQASVDHGHEGRSSHGHGRSISSSSVTRTPYPPGSAGMTRAHLSGFGPRQGAPPSVATGAGQGRVMGHFDGYEGVPEPYYTAAHSMPHGGADLSPYGGYGVEGGGGRGHEHGHEYGHPAGPPPPPSLGPAPGHGPPPLHAHQDVYPQHLHAQQQQQAQHLQRQFHPHGHPYQHYGDPAPPAHGAPLAQHHAQTHGHAPTQGQGQGQGQGHAHVQAHAHAHGHAAQHPASHTHTHLHPQHQHGPGSHGYVYAAPIASQAEETMRSRE